MNSNRVDERFVDLTPANNLSRKQLQAKMITNRKMIPYHNSRIQNIYNTILNSTYLDNLNLSLTLGVEGYKYYWNILFNSPKTPQAKKNKIFEYRIFAYPIVYDVRFPSFVSETYVIYEDDERVYVYGDLSGNQINGLSEYTGEVPMTVQGNNIELLNVGNVIHNTLQLTNKYGIHTTLDLTFKKQITYTYTSGSVVYYQYTSTSGEYGGTTETYLSNLIVNDITSWQKYIDRHMSQVFTRDGNRINIYGSLLKDTHIEINSTNQISSSLQGYIEDSKLYLSKSYLSFSDFVITGNNVINITNPYGVTITLQAAFYRGVFQDYRVPRWIFSVTGLYTYGLNVLNVADVDSWESFFNYEPDLTLDDNNNISSWETYTEDYKLYLSKTDASDNIVTNENKMSYHVYLADTDLDVDKSNLSTSDTVTTGDNIINYYVNIVYNAV